MDKRFNPISLQEQVQLRKQAVDGVLAHPEWDLAKPRATCAPPCA
jgi:hypothetical protein